jgi:hypothetical protein
MLGALTVHEDAWLREGPIFGSGEVVGYRVGGFPSGRSARVVNFKAPNGNDWRIMLINGDNSQDAWLGHHESFQAALTALRQMNR